MKMSAVARAWGFWIAAMAVWEWMLRMEASSGLDYLPWVAAFVVAFSGILALLTSLPGWAGKLFSWTVAPLVVVLYGVQLVYYDIFGSLASLAFAAMGGEAITQFWPIVLEAIWRCLPRLLGLMVPLAAFYLLRWKKCFPAVDWQGRLGMGGCCALLLGALISAAPQLPATATVDVWANRFGLLAAEALDLKQLVLGPESDGLTPSGEILDYSAEEWNVMEEMDFAQLMEAAQGQGELETISAYLAGKTATAKNEYTGLFEGYNLIVVCAEGFSSYLIDPELTPTLYRLSQGGIVFENFYNCFPNLTTNGEYSLCMGLLPDLAIMSFSRSASNYLPFTLARLAEQEGMTALAYHNNYGTFYNRINTHTNMGYDFRAIQCGLDMEKGSPSSDLLMMQASVDDYLTDEPFHAYYMTYSGHAGYRPEDNQMAAQNWDLVADVEGSESYKGYLASQLELEAAMTYLVDRLEQAGVADRTVIVLTADHMPYGLPEEDYEKLAGSEAVEEPFWKYRNSFICWTGSMEEQPLVVEEYCCTIDILPTLCNLFGFAYDSRMLAGRDVLAEGEHIAVLKDGSFLADGVYYVGATGEFVWQGQPDEARAAMLLQTVEDQFALSSAILQNDYYRFAFLTLGLADEEEMDRPDAPSFTDIAGTWYEQSVEELVTLGAVQGAGTGTFSGNDRVSRGEMVGIIARSLQLPVSNVTLPYTDVPQGAWYLDALTGMYAAGMLPEGEREFRQADPATVEEVREILVAAAGFAGVPNAAAWVDAHMETALANQQADEDNLCLDGQFSRGALAYMMAEMLRATGAL